MRNSLTMLGLTIAIAATLLTGWVQGRLGNRWGLPVDLAAAGERIGAVPERIGDWQLQSSEPFDDEVVRMLQCFGNFSRVYVNRTTGEAVRVELLVGPPGPTAVHTPEICHASRNHTLKDSRTAVRVRASEQPDESFWRVTFQSNDLEHSLLRVMYAWSGTDGVWRASQDPRFEYGGTQLLYKVQLAASLSGEEESSASDPCQRFLESLLPVLDATLFPPVTR
ncbi:MAG: exosortase-associated EpsI family protein [Planctomycetia bacterium]|nr:exosortase-associated EpsI family protein [Planctomycetia bacterium]